jgi:hypothetical protein
VQVEVDDDYRSECSFGSFHHRLPLWFDVGPNQI